MEQFLALAKNARGVSAVALIQEVLNHSNVFVFGELLQTPTIAELAGTEHWLYHDLLNIFAFGTYATYKERQDRLPQLTPAQLQKLRFLTIVSLATGSKQIKYEDLQRELDIGNIRELEDLIILAVYADVVRGKLDQINSLFDVEFAIGRDIQQGSIEGMAQTLEKWSDHCQEALKSIDVCITLANNKRAKYTDEQEEHKRMIEEATKQVTSQIAAKSTGDYDASAQPFGEPSFNNVQPTAKRQKMKSAPSLQRKGLGL